MKCLYCGEENPEEAIFCQACSKRLMIVGGQEVEMIDEKIAEAKNPTGFMGWSLSKGWWEIYAALMVLNGIALGIVSIGIGFWQIGIVFFLFFAIVLPLGYYYIYVPESQRRKKAQD